MVKTVVATAKTPKSCGLRRRATIAVTPIPENRRNIALEKLQIAPLRTFADSDRGLALSAAVIAETRKATGSLTTPESGADTRRCAAIR